MFWPVRSINLLCIVHQFKKTIFLNNCYPLKLLHPNCFQFLQYCPKTKPLLHFEPTVHRKKHRFFRQKNGERNLNIDAIFSHHLFIKASKIASKASDCKLSKPDTLESNNCCSHFKCTCSSQKNKN